MSKKYKHDLETRIEIVNEYQKGHTNFKDLGEKYGIHNESVS